MKLLATSADIEKRTQEIAQEIIDTYKNTNVLFVCLLKGAVPFASDLMREITRQDPDFHPQLEYMQTSTYGNERHATQTRITIDLPEQLDLTNRTVVVIDDVLDKGLTGEAVSTHLLKKGAAAVKLVVLVEKNIARDRLRSADIAGFVSGPEWLTGMGMDDVQLAPEGNRWLNVVGIVKAE